MADQQTLKQQVLLSRKCYQQLQEATALAACDQYRQTDQKIRCSLPTSRQNAWNMLSLDDEMSVSTSLMSEYDISTEHLKKAEYFRTKQRHPNVHIGLHLSELASEYATPSNCNVLIGEDKHW